MSAAESPAESIYFAALAKASLQEQVAYLDAACGADANLRRRVERLLQAQPKVGSFLEAVPATPQATVAQPTVCETTGTVIGPYKLIEQIGEGGMGAVWMAQQTEPVKRVVAVKLIKAGMDSKQVIARFAAERQALALMDHPNIARVLDGGTTSSARPYFVMDLVKGVPITRYCDEHHLTPRQRLELFMPVCQAVQHAHQKGIIHRDLKPSNVLIALYDGKPVPKVIDFGVAKAAGQPLTEKTLVTGFGNIVGTLEYMSPEQAEINQLDIDTRSDVYSLGVLLYELLAGSPPFSRKDLEKAGMLEMLRVIREQEPSKPSTKLSTAEGLPTLAANRGTEPAKLTKLVRGELDWIVMKALEKDRSRRYETANGFAVDVQRYLADEAVLACPPSAAYRLRKLVRRNKGSAVAVILVLLALVAGAAVSTWQAVRATRAEHLAGQRLIAEQNAHQEAEAARQATRADFVRTRETVDRMLNRVADPRLVNVPGLEPVRKALIEDAIALYEQLLADRKTDPQLRLEIAQAYMTHAWIEGSTGDPIGRRPEQWARSLDMLEALAHEFPEDLNYRAALASWLSRTGASQVAYNPDHWRESERALRRAAELQESVVKARPDSVGDALQLAKIMRALGIALRTGGRWDECVTVWKRGLDVCERAFNRGTVTPRSLCVQLALLTLIADALWPAKAPEAEAHLARAQELVERSLESKITPELFNDTAADIAAYYRLLGLFRRNQGRHKDCEVALRRVAAIMEQDAGSRPSDYVVRARLGWALWDLALRGLANRPAEAEPVHRRAWEVREQNIREAPIGTPFDWWPAYLHSTRALAASLRAQGRADDAADVERHAEEFAAEQARQFPNHVPNDYGCLDLLVSSYLRKSGPKEPGMAYDQFLKLADAIQERVAESPSHSRLRRGIATSYIRFTDAFAAAGLVKEAEGAKQRAAVALHEAIQRHPDDLDLRLTGVEWFGAQGKWAESAADALAKHAAATAATQIPDARRKIAALYAQLGRVLEKAGALDKAEAAYHGHRAITDKIATEYPKVSLYRGDTIWVRSTLCRLLQATGRMKEAETLFAQNLALAEKLVADLPEGNHNEWPAEVHTERGHFLSRAGRYREAADDLAQALKLNPESRWLRLYLAACSVLSDDAPEYRRTCSEALKRFGESEDEYAAYFAIRACVLAPNAVSDPTAPVQVMQRVVSKNPSGADFLFTLGMAHFRAGQFQEAQARLEEAVKTDRSWTEITCVTGLALALVHHHSGRTEQARKWLTQTVERLERGAREKGNVLYFPPHPADWLSCLILRKEAETLIGKVPTEKESKK